MLTAATERAAKGRTKLEMAQRHVREGLERLERQRALISGLIRGGHHAWCQQHRNSLVRWSNTNPRSSITSNSCFASSRFDSRQASPGRPMWAALLAR
jgi:hypothetical protein